MDPIFLVKSSGPETYADRQTRETAEMSVFSGYEGYDEMRWGDGER